jgi:dUTP pyrophosphatase
MAVLSKEHIAQLLEDNPSLIEGYIDIGEQLQPNGFDLTLRQVSHLESKGCIAANNKQRKVSDLSPLIFNNKGFLDLKEGIYSITFNEIVNLPKNVMALGKPRSSLLRCGVTIGTAVWDAGYSGRSESLLVVYHTKGFHLQRNARVMQLVFFELCDHTTGYNGTYQRENLDLTIKQ